MYFYTAATQKLSCRHLLGPSPPPPTLFCFGLVWSNHIARKMYPEMDIRRTDHFSTLDKFLVYVVAVAVAVPVPVFDAKTP